MRDLHRQITRLQAELVHAVGEFDAAREYELEEYKSTQSWLRHELRLHPREAAFMVGMARQLPKLPAVDAAFSAGDISQSHVAVITRTARQVGAEHVAASQDALLSMARSGTPEHLRVATQHLRYCVDPDGAERDAVRAYERRELSVAPTIWGMMAVNGLLDPAGGATVLAALDALTAPPRDHDPRTAGQRRADAFVELCRRALDGGELPQVNGEKPHLLVTVPYETLAGRLDGEPARLGWTGPVSATDARLLACDCAVIPAVLGAAGEVLDIGRKSRIWPTAIRRAIELRDKTCRHINCDAPARYCDVHHKVHWADGGPTSYDGGILACRYHHTRMHKYGVNYLPNGRFTIMRN